MLTADSVQVIIGLVDIVSLEFKINYRVRWCVVMIQGTIGLDELIEKLQKVKQQLGGADVPVFIDGDKIYSISEVDYKEKEKRIVLW